MLRILSKKNCCALSPSIYGYYREPSSSCVLIDIVLIVALYVKSAFPLNVVFNVATKPFAATCKILEHVLDFVTVPLFCRIFKRF